MENEVKQRNQRNRRRERAQRMQAQRESKVKDGDSGEDESPAREKPPRPPARRKRSKEPLGEEDIIDGFAIMAFRTYEDLEAAVKCAASPRTNVLSTKPATPRSIPTHTLTSITLLQDAGTSDDSGRASERLTGSSVAPRDPDSSRDRLSDASSRCSSGKGYICDSEGDDDKASPENSRNTSPKYHDASMEDVSDAGALFRVAGTGAAAGGKNELVARGGSGGALALSRAPVGGSASPAPAPLPQPAPSPAPAALPPPALPPPPFRADTPHRNNGAHIPALDGHAATQIPARPVGAAGPDTPERPASNNKLQPGARAAADSPTPAPPAPPAPSPLFPSHTAYQSHAASALPDYRHTNHETRTEPAEQSPAPLDLHSGRPPLLAPTAAPPLTSLASRVLPAPASFPNRVNGAPPGAGPLPAPASNPSCLPSPAAPGLPASPTPTSRPYPAPAIGSSHVNSGISSSIHNHSIPFQSQTSLQKHSVPTVYPNRPSHLAPFSLPNHVASNHILNSTTSQTTATNATHPINSHSIINHAPHLPIPPSNSTSLTTSTPNHIGPPPVLSSTTSSSISSYTPGIKHPGLSMPPHSIPLVPPPVSLHTPINHLDASPTSSAPSMVTPTTSSSSHPISSHMLAPPVVDSRQPPVIDSRQPPLVDSRQTSLVDPRKTPVSSCEQPARSESAAVMSLSSNGYPPPAVYSGSNYPPLYAPYATTLQHTPYLPAAAASPRNTTDTRTSLSSSPLVAPKTPKGVRPHTPGSTGAAGAPLAPLSYSPSPTRERESFSNISSLSRSTPASSAPVSIVSAPAPLTAPLAAPLAAPLTAPLATPLTAGLSSSLVGGLVPSLSTGLAAPTPTPAAPGAPHLSHSLAPVPTVPSISSSAKPPAHWGVTRPSTSERGAGYAPAPPLFAAPLPPHNPNPFSAESLFQTSPGADLLRRELDNRFLAAAGAVGAAAVGAGAAAVGARTELHHHQHQHTHVHQHPHHAPPHPPHPPPHHPAHPPPHHHQLLMPHAPLFKDMGKMPSLYRTGLGLGYPYSSSLLHPTAPYVPPAPLTSYAPKPVVSAASDPATKTTPRPVTAKTGKWNAMHVRIAWEIYNHQQKEKGGAGAVPGGAGLAGGVGGAGGQDKDKLRAYPPPAPPPPYRSPYDLPPAPYLPHHSHLGVSPFARYGAGPFPGPFGLSAYGRELALSSSLHGMPPLSLHDAWRIRPPAPAPAPASASAVAAEASRREHEERERARREREERERRDREERERRKQRERELERVRTRSPLRNGAPEPLKEERREPPRSVAGPGPLAYGAGAGAAWDPYRFDPLHHMRFAPMVEAALRQEEEHRAKMLSAYAHHQHPHPHAHPHHPQLKAGALLHRPLPPHAPLPPLTAHAPLAPLPPLAPPLAPLAPLAPLDLLKKEEPR